MDTPYIGMLIRFAGNFQILGYAYCNGQTMSIGEYTALFAILGTTYGGDGQTTFGLPNLQGRYPINQGAGPGLGDYSLGEAGGATTATMTTANMPQHTHIVMVPTTDGPGDKDQPTGNILALSSNGNTNFAAPGQGAGTYGGVTESSTGGGQPFSTMPPYLAINYLIALEGIFPSRN